MPAKNPDDEIRAKQEIARSNNDRAVQLLHSVQESLKPFEGPKKLDDDRERKMQEKMKGGMSPGKATQWAWCQQSQRHNKKRMQEEARRLFNRGRSG